MYTKSTVTNHLSTFSSATPNLLQMLDSEFLQSGNFQIWRHQEAELHKAASSLVPSPFWCQPVNTTPCWPQELTAKVRLEPWSPGTCRKPGMGNMHQLQQRCRCDTPPAAAQLPQGKAAADSGAPGPNTSAVKHHPVANKLCSVPLTSGFHLRLCMKRGLVSCAYVYKVSFLAK